MRRHAMTRPRIATTLGLGLGLGRGLGPARIALSLAALGLAACSFSFKAGSDAPEAGKPTADGDAPASKPTRKPIDEARPAEPAEPSEPAAPSEPADAAGPTRTPPVEEPPPVVEPKLTAVCRVTDPSLEALCHRALDPIAADDIDAWADQLGDGIVVTRPGFRKGTQRIQGPQAVRDAVTRAGGLRALLNLRPTDRLVGTVSNDCRQCRRSFVAFEANTRSGTIVVGMEMSQPPRVLQVDVGSRMRRTNLAPQEPTPVPRPPVPRPPVPPAADPPASVEPTPPATIVAPTHEKKAEPTPSKKKVEP